METITTTIDMRSVSSQLMEYCEQKGLGKIGQDFFANDWPDEEKTKSPISVLFVDTVPGVLHGTLKGDITCQSEFFVLQSRAKNEEESRKALVPIAEELHRLKKVLIEGLYYMNTQMLIPIHYVGTDKNNKAVSEVMFSVMRRKV